MLPCSSLFCTCRRHDIIKSTKTNMYTCGSYSDYYIECFLLTTFFRCRHELGWRTTTALQFPVRHPDEQICLYLTFVFQFRMTEFGTLEIVTDLEVKGQKAEPETLDPAQSHTPTPPPESQLQTGKDTAPANQSEPGSSKGKGRTAHL